MAASQEGRIAGIVIGSFFFVVFWSILGWILYKKHMKPAPCPNCSNASVRVGTNMPQEMTLLKGDPNCVKCKGSGWVTYRKHLPLWVWIVGLPGAFIRHELKDLHPVPKPAEDSNLIHKYRQAEEGALAEAKSPLGGPKSPSAVTVASGVVASETKSPRAVSQPSANGATGGTGADNKV